jgi:mRNA interferase MazF
MYMPDAGDIAWIDFSPQAGSETAQRHAAVVLTPAAYSIATGLALVVPMTTKAKGGTFEVPMRGAKRAKGVVLANALRSIDYAARRAEKFDECPPDVLRRIRDIGEALVRG